MSISVDLNTQSNQMMKPKMTYIFKENTLKQKLKQLPIFLSGLFLKMCEYIPESFKEIC